MTYTDQNKSNGNGSYRLVASTDLYVDGLVVRGGKPLMWLFDGGYVSLGDNGGTTGRNYYVADHLGSTRKVVDSDDTIKETINYYPFGSEMRMEDPALPSSEEIENAILKHGTNIKLNLTETTADAVILNYQEKQRWKEEEGSK